jgi:hypothetical protein
MRMRMRMMMRMMMMRMRMVIATTIMIMTLPKVGIEPQQDCFQHSHGGAVDFEVSGGESSPANTLLILAQARGTSAFAKLAFAKTTPRINNDMNH